MRRFTATAAGFASLLLVAGCATHSSARRPAPTTRAPDTSAGPSVAPAPRVSVCGHEGASFAGTLRMVGGPAGAQPIGVAGTVTATRISSGGSLAETCRATVAANGDFSLVLAPGTYRFTGRSPSFVEGRVDCAAEGDVVIAGPSGNGVIPNGRNRFVFVDCQRR